MEENITLNTILWNSYLFIKLKVMQKISNVGNQSSVYNNCRWK